MTTHPYEHLRDIHPFTLASPDVREDGALPLPQHSAMTGAAGAADVPPRLQWSGVPADARSFVVTMFDPDAPTPSGFWHWAVIDLPGAATGLDASDGLPPGAKAVPNDVRLPHYVGAMPPEGTGRHRYIIAVHALDVASVTELGFDPQGTPAMLNFLMLGHTVGLATLTAWADGN
jgi:Raf kinase inhibitor-like YbhB/YbcL family protein